MQCVCQLCLPANSKLRSGVGTPSPSCLLVPAVLCRSSCGFCLLELESLLAVFRRMPVGISATVSMIAHWHDLTQISHCHPMTAATMGSAIANIASWPATPGCPQPSSGAPMKLIKCVLTPNFARAVAMASSTQGLYASVMGPTPVKMGRSGFPCHTVRLKRNSTYLQQGGRGRRRT